ncbi:MAG: hypothetical protein AAFX87_05630 [Bacteroidota bacterium]
MKVLHKDWLTNDLIDFEYKKYVILGYLKTVKESFSKVELYPFMSDLIFHYKNLIDVKNNQEIIDSEFPKEISKEDIKKLKMSYKKIVEDDETMNEIRDIIEFSIPLFKSALKEGKDIYEFVESNCELNEVGLSSLYTNEGYLFVTLPPEHETMVYRYQVTVFESADEKLRGINTTFIDTFWRAAFGRYEDIKLNLIKQFKDLPNPATYLIISKLHFPLRQTFMPVAKRLLVKHLMV